MAESLTPPDRVAPPGAAAPHRRRFTIAFVLLGAVAAAAALLTLVFAREDRPAAFSTFTPTKTDQLDRAEEIAAYVALRYRSASGERYVSVSAGQTPVPNVPGGPPVTAVNTGGADGPLFRFELDSPLFYRLCGPAAGCAIPAPPEEPAVHEALLAREALELSLLSLRHIDDVGSVIVILPSGFGNDESSDVVYWFRRGDLETALDRPLRDTLPEPVPRPTELTGDAQRSIRALTLGRKRLLFVALSADSTTSILELRQLR